METDANAQMAQNNSTDQVFKAGSVEQSEVDG